MKRTLSILLAILMAFSLCTVAFAEGACTHPNIQKKEADTAPLCGTYGNIECWWCSDCNSYFADQEASQPLTNSEVFVNPPAYNTHDFQFELGFEASDENYWVSVDPQIDAYYQAMNGQSFMEMITEMGYTFSVKYCAHCGFVVIQSFTYNGVQYTDESKVDDSPFVIHEPGEVIADPLEGLVAIPKSTDGLKNGAKYFDMQAFLVDSEAPEDVIAMYTSEAMKVYTNEAGTVIVFALNGAVMMRYDASVSEGEAYAVTYFMSFIKEFTCTHTWGDWATTKEATETEKGEETRTCTICGDTETKETPVKEAQKPVDEGKDDGKTTNDENKDEGKSTNAFVKFINKIIDFFKSIFNKIFHK